MKLSIRPENMRMTRAIALFVETRVRGALRRAARSVSVRVTLQRTEEGGVEAKRCRVQVMLPGGRPIVTSAAHRDLYVAITSACMRLGAILRPAAPRPVLPRRPLARPA